MPKLLSVKGRVLLGLAFLGDVLDEARLLGGLVSMEYENVYGWVPPQFRRNNFYKAVSDLLKTEDIEKRVEKGQVYLVLTGRGEKAVARRFPLIKLAGARWDGLFTQVVFDIEEVAKHTRNSLRQRLLSWTFGRLQKSVYITPHDLAQDIAEFIQVHRLAKKVKVFRSQLILGDPQKLAEKVWKVSSLDRKYRRLLNEWEQGKGLTGGKRKKLVRKLKARLLELMITDPFLPEELLPDDWVGEKARLKIGSLK